MQLIAEYRNRAKSPDSVRGRGRFGSSDIPKRKTNGGGTHLAPAVYQRSAHLAIGARWTPAQRQNPKENRRRNEGKRWAYLRFQPSFASRTWTLCSSCYHVDLSTILMSWPTTSLVMCCPTRTETAGRDGPAMGPAKQYSQFFPGFLPRRGPDRVC
jgi:hypothetical protein